MTQTAPQPVKLVPKEEQFKAEVDETVVSILEDNLKLAKEGKITGIAVVATLTGDMIDYQYSKMISRNDVIGGMERLKHHLLMQMYEE